MKSYDLNKLVNQILEKFDNELITSPLSLQKILKFEYKIDVELDDLEVYFERKEDYERESRKIEYDIRERVYWQ